MESTYKEWESLMNENFDEETHKKLISMDCDRLWFHLVHCTDPYGNPQFYFLAQAAISALTVPHANSDSERLFSVMNWLHTKTKNSFHPEIVEAIIRTREHCVPFAGPFQPTDEMIRLCLERSYNQKPEKSVITSVAAALLGCIGLDVSSAI